MCWELNNFRVTKIIFHRTLERLGEFKTSWR